MSRHGHPITQGTLGETRSEKEPAHETLPEKQGASEGGGQPRRAEIPQPGGQHECRQETAGSPEEAQVMKAKTKDPKGGLTPAGRRMFARKEDAHLKPGVKKPMSEMTPQEMKRKGSWAVRFYGRKRLSPLQDKHGQPTRFALTAAAWGEPVPRTEAAARRIAEKGRRLLQRYDRIKQKRESHRSSKSQ
jgi:hypothetical protein